MDKTEKALPLKGVTVIEMAGIGPGPFCGMLLADMGADVIRVERPSAHPDMRRPVDPMLRSRRSIAVNLKSVGGLNTVRRLIEQADILIEGYRPGVMERIGLGPDECLKVNPGIVYGRVTGWGQQGPLAQHAGHDINFLALSGMLHMIGNVGEKPVIPLNFVGDYGAGGMLLALGVVSGLLRAKLTGEGTVVDSAIIDGLAAMISTNIPLLRNGIFDENVVGDHLLSGQAHFYGVYETKDGKYIAIGSVEPQFYEKLISALGVDADEFQPYGWKGIGSLSAKPRWSRLKQNLEAVFKTKTRDQWTEILMDCEVCFAPVLTVSESVAHSHNRKRGTYIEVDGQIQNAPAPRFSATVENQPTSPRLPGEDTVEVLRGSGFCEQEIAALIENGDLMQS
jgi:alpha-methylacyl-CoA racemase